MAALSTWPTWTDDDGSGTTGSIIDNTELQKMKDAAEAEVESANNPNVTTKSVQDNVIAGIPIHYFGGQNTHAVSQTSVPAGTAATVLHPGTGVWNLDSANTQGTYRLEVYGLVTAGTMKIELFNLTDTPNTSPRATVSITSTTGERQRATITFAATGTAKDYGVKVYMDSGSPAGAEGYAYNIQVIRTA
jgi:hypothetical protein